MKALFLKGKTDFLVKYAFDKYRFLKNLINIFIICLIISGVRVWQEAKKKQQQQRALKLELYK